MEDLQLALTVSRTDQRNFGVWLRSWQVGHILQALVVDKGPSGDLVLRVGGQQITATTDFPVQRGAQLLLQIASVSPTPILKLLKIDVAHTGKASVSTPHSEHIQALLPRQAQVHEPFALLASMLANAKNLTLSEQQSHVFQSLLQLAATPSQLNNAQAVRQAFRRSGLWSEARTAGHTEADGAGLDVKGLLFRLLDLLPGLKAPGKQLRGDAQSAQGEPAAAEADVASLRRLLGGALSRITLNQLGSAKAAEQGSQQWLIEIPLLVGDGYSPLQALITREPREKGRQAADEPPGWQVELNLEAGDLGHLQVDIFLRGEKLSATLYSPEQDTVDHLSENLPHLKKRLEMHGLDVPVLVCHRGKRSNQATCLSFNHILAEQA